MELKKFIGLSTLKKEYSISCKDYITMGIMGNKYVVVCDNTLLGEFDEVKRANEVFYFYVNKI